MIVDQQKRIVVTGMGVVSGLGCDVPTFWENLLAGKSGIGPITRFDASAYRCRIAGEVRQFDIGDYMPAKEARRMDLFCHFAVGAAEQAVRQARLLDDSSVDPNRVGVTVSSGTGGIRSLQENCRRLEALGPGRASPLIVPMLIADMAAGVLSIRYRFGGPNLATVTACATATHSIGESAWMIARGDADVMLAGGAEGGVVPIGIAGFGAMKALTSRNDDPEHASRPFDLHRDGFVPAEGAGVLVLESLEHARARGVEILAEVAGYGLSGDAYHITAPDPGGNGAVRAMRMACRHAGIEPAEIDYVNAHGTSTPLNDKTETAALHTLLGPAARGTPVSSTKSMTGHALGAAGGLESIVCVMACRQDIVPGTMNYEEPDPECDLDYVPNAKRKVPVRIAMNTNLGFGGHNGVLLFKKWA